VPEPVSVRATPPKYAHINKAAARRYTADLTAARCEAVLLKIELLYIFSSWAREIYYQNVGINTIWNNITENYIKFSKRKLKDEQFVIEVQQTD
jgi:hypothetical protein